MGQVNVSLPSDGTTAEVSDYNTPITTIVTEINGNLDNSNLDAAAAIAGSKLADGGVTSAKLAEAFVRGRYQIGDGTNSAPTGLTIQHGWSYIEGDGTARISKTITFPVAFSSPPIVVATFAGVDTSSPAGTSLADYSTVSTTLHGTTVAAIGATTFNMYIWRASGTLVSGNFHAFTWIAIGTV